MKLKHARAANSHGKADGNRTASAVKRFKIPTVSCDSITVTYHVRAIKLPDYYAVLRANLQRDPGVEGADQSRPTHAGMLAHAGLVQCFRRSIVVGRRNVLVSRYLPPKSIGDNSIDI